MMAGPGDLSGLETWGFGGIGREPRVVKFCGVVCGVHKNRASGMTSTQRMVQTTLAEPADPAAMSPAEVTEKLGLHKMRDRSWYVHPR